MGPLMATLPPGGTFVYTEPGEQFFLFIKIAAIVGLLIASPYVMLQVWLFVAPGLYANEKRLAVPFVFFSTALFLAGAAFSHYLAFPPAFQFAASPAVVSAAHRAGVLDLRLPLLAMGVMFQLMLV
jgi:sec-independent protein translocase protein TatC